jgi:hypothetical protein
VPDTSTTDALRPWQTVPAKAGWDSEKARNGR